jgi:hypothetical protein
VKTDSKPVQLGSASNDFVRLARLVAASRGNESEMKRLARGIPSPRLHEAIETRAAVLPGTTSDATWAGPLVSLSNAFADSLRPYSVFDRMIGDMIRVPVNSRVVVASSAVQPGSPVLEFGAKPISAMSFGSEILEPAKVVSHIVITEELARLNSPSANSLVGTLLRQAVALSSDQYFVDKLLVGTGVTTVSSTGPSAANFISDIQAALAAINIGQSSRLYLILPADVWKAHSFERDVGPAFESSERLGNAITTLPTSTLSDTMILADATQIAGVSENIELASSSEASVQLSDSPTDSASSSVSLWQADMVAVRATRFLAVSLLRSDGAVIVENVTA